MIQVVAKIEVQAVKIKFKDLKYAAAKHAGIL
jgi:hypothetical protein